MRKEYPILEFDPSKNSVIEPTKLVSNMGIPQNVVICFFNDVIARLKSEGKLKLLTCMRSEIGEHPIYEFQHQGRAVTLFHPGVGAPLAAGLMEEVIALGGTRFIACGGAGVLDRDIAVGHIIVPVAAVRDEGTSYHYLPPSREVQVNRRAVEAIEAVLKRHKCKYILSKTWTTDSMYRETPQKISLRKQEGCLAVEMECSAFCAVAEFRNVIFGQILYGGDDVSCDEWDSRCWNDRTDVREAVLKFAIEACLNLGMKEYANGFEIKKTDSNDVEFLDLVKLLDIDLWERYGDVQKHYQQFNKVDYIKDVVLIYKGNTAVACGAFKEYDSSTVEIKRIFVVKDQRGQGISKMVVQTLEELAAGSGYQSAVLETGIKQPEAISLYKKMGYGIIPNYGPYIGNTNSVCMRKEL